MDKYIPVSLETNHVSLNGSFDELCFQRIIALRSTDSEDDVHLTTIDRIHTAVEETIGVFNDGIQHGGFPLERWK